MDAHSSVARGPSADRDRNGMAVSRLTEVALTREEVAMKPRFQRMIAFFRALAKKEPVRSQASQDDSDEYMLEKERHRGMPGPT